jgi:glycine cleavage system H protein
MNVPAGLQYTRSDEWIKVEGDVATIGITDYAQHELGEIVYIELPEVGSNLSPGVPFGVVESVKAVAELMSPLGGEVLESNQPLSDDPSIVNSSPFDNGWMIKVRVAGEINNSDLLDADAYTAYRGS